MKNVILGVVEIFHIHSQESIDEFKGFNPFVIIYADWSEKDPSLE